MNKKKVLYIVIGFVFLAVLTQLLWLQVLISVIVFFYFLLRLVFIKWKKRISWLVSLFTIFIIFLFAIIFRILFIEIYLIPSGSMENTLYPGDKIVVSKINYGPRMPYSPFDIPWVNLLFYMNKEARANVDSTWFNYKRLKGFSKIRRNDVIVFETKKRSESSLIKRCIGLPGEELKIMDGIVYCDNLKIDTPNNIKLKFRIWVNNKNKFNSLCDSLHIPVNNFKFNDIDTNKNIILNLTQFNIVNSSPYVDSMKLFITKPDTLPHTFPYHSRYLWTIENFGPIVIPKEGMEVKLTPENFILYRKILREYEGFGFWLKDGKVYQNGELTASYTFKQNYYFMMGDNRYESADSRIWGFLPEEGVIGKAVLVLYSNDDSGFKWGRLFKLIH